MKMKMFHTFTSLSSFFYWQIVLHHFSTPNFYTYYIYIIYLFIFLLFSSVILIFIFFWRVNSLWYVWTLEWGSEKHNKYKESMYYKIDRIDSIL